jgi:hypothetical protein
MIRIKLSAFVVICLLCDAAFAQTDTIRLMDKRLNTAELKPQLNQYLVYFQSPAKKKTLGFWYWLRDIKETTENGQRVFTITQHWYGSDSSAYRFVYSKNRASDFAPIYHEEVVKNEVHAYNWGEKQIAGADTVPQNVKKSFVLNYSAPNFNWNLDIETFEMLPLAEGKTFAINFYDAGFDPPAYVIYKVTGSEIINTLDNKSVECWKLYTEGVNNGTKYSETYWLSKKEHEFLKEEDSFNGIYRYKIKLMGSATDILARFNH